MSALEIAGIVYLILFLVGFVSVIVISFLDEDEFSPSFVVMAVIVGSIGQLAMLLPLISHVLENRRKRKRRRKHA